MIFITADGGGTKLTAFAFDEKLNILSAAKGGGVNSLFMSEDDARNNMENVANGLIDGLEKELGKVSEADGVYCTLAGKSEYFINALERRIKLKKVTRLNEGQLGVLAGTLGQNGLLVISGTGSDCFLIENGVSVDMIGGWGQYFGDEGSGFDMGRKAIVAAIKSYDGRGQKTELETLVFDELGLKKSLWEVCSIHKRPSFRKDVAALTKAIETACKNGDYVANEIVKDAADELSLAAVTLMKKRGYGKNDGFIFTTSGGGWKTSEKMTEIFVSGVKKEYPLAEFIKPEFEPVAGGAVKYIYDSGETPDKEILKEKLRDYTL